MSENDTVVRSLEDLVRRREAGITTSDWERVDALTDEEIDEAIDEDPDTEALTDDWFRRARLVLPGDKEPA
ncbi:MAG: hypothetical protein GVY18_13555 [Bacteroidetes bacterium]|jgi:hypothetical protein|nr:hypothetical protein [Bacteroidota bacterium]